jgi:hypothetical protein
MEAEHHEIHRKGSTKLGWHRRKIETKTVLSATFGQGLYSG